MPATIDEAVRALGSLARERTDLPPAYLVGGAVRDALLGYSVTELDIATTEPQRWAEPLASLLDAAPLEVGSHFPIHHLPLADGAIDIAPISDALDDDLARRDFTVNALAVPLYRLPDNLANLDRADVIDQHEGLLDLDQRQLRLIAERALVDDPIRMLRAVRFATRLDFTLDTAAETAIASHAAGLSEVAPDRVGQELSQLFSSSRASHSVRLLERTGLLYVCFPELTEGDGMDQRPRHRLSVLQHQIAASEWLDTLLAPKPPSDEPAATIWNATWNTPWPTSIWGDVRQHLAQHAATLRIATLLHDVGKPRTRTIEADGRTRFFHHGNVGADIARARLRSWRFPERVVERISLLLQQHLRPGQITGAGELPTRRALYRFHKRLGDATPDVCLLFLADSLATADPEELAQRWPTYVAHIQRIICLEPPPSAARIRKIVDGNAVMAATGLPPGPQLGEILDQIAEAAAAGNITNEDEALALAVSRVGASPPQNMG